MKLLKAVRGLRPQAALADGPPEAALAAADAARPAHAGARRHLFVTGCARSGTTVLTRLLNRHSDVAVGYERFRNQALAGALTPDLYGTARFREFRPEDRERARADGYRAGVVAKYHAAAVVGDKHPRLIERMEQLGRFPDVRVIFAVREPYAVAQSFEKRRTRAGDAWDRDRGYADAVATFNAAMRAILVYAATGRPHLVVDYDTLFFERAGLDALWRFVGVDPGRAGPTEDIFAAAAADEARLTKSRIGRAVAARAAFDDYRSVLALGAAGARAT